MKLKPDQERVKNLLSDTVALLCKNGLAFEKELKIQGLLGVTIDDNDVFIVHLNESYAGLLAAEEAETVSVTSKDSVAPEQKSKDSRNEGGAPKRPHPSPMRSHSQSPHTESKRPRPSSSHLQSPHRRASHSSSNDSVVVQVKQEKEDDIELVEAKSEPNFGGYYGAHSEMGGPHGKRRTEMFPAGNAQEPYITSVMRNPGGGEPGSSWDPNSSQPSTLAHDSQLDATSGSSQWNPGLGLPPGSEGLLPMFGYGPADTARDNTTNPATTSSTAAAAMGTVAVRRSWTATDKPHVCRVIGCNKSYFHIHDLRRHEKQKHMDMIEAGLLPQLKGGSTKQEALDLTDDMSPKKGLKLPAIPMAYNDTSQPGDSHNTAINLTQSASDTEVPTQEVVPENLSQEYLNQMLQAAQRKIDLSIGGDNPMAGIHPVILQYSAALNSAQNVKIKPENNKPGWLAGHEGIIPAAIPSSIEMISSHDPNLLTTTQDIDPFPQRHQYNPESTISDPDVYNTDSYAQSGIPIKDPLIAKSSPDIKEDVDLIHEDNLPQNMEDPNIDDSSIDGHEEVLKDSDVDLDDTQDSD